MSIIPKIRQILSCARCAGAAKFSFSKNDRELKKKKNKVGKYLPFTSRTIAKKIFCKAPKMGKTVFDLVKGKPIF